MRLFFEMHLRGLEPNVITTYGAMISACEKDKRPERALQLFEEMQQRGLEPNVIAP